MTQYPFKSNADSYSLLTSVREGAPVYDSTNKKIGKVKHVQFRDESEADPIPKPEEFYSLPREAQAELAQDGFVQIDCGWLAHDRFATPNQIAEILDDSINLHVMGEQLIVA